LLENEEETGEVPPLAGNDSKKLPKGVHHFGPTEFTKKRQISPKTKCIKIYRFREGLCGRKRGGGLPVVMGR